MKKDGITVTRRELLAGAAAAGGMAMTGWPAISLAQSSMASSTRANDKLKGLAELLRGDLITPQHDQYDAQRKVWNGMIDRHPSAIARCTGVADVIQVVKYARENEIAVAVRGGGHNVAGKAVRDDAITIDLAPMHGIRVDPAMRRARAQGGGKWGLFDRETLAFGLATTGGTVSSTGIGGLTLGGGLGWLMREYGLSCDNLVSADVVTADGQVLIASAEQNPDLLWALKGGGGNFGVVTSFEFSLHEIQPIVGGLAMYPADRVRDVLHFFRDYTATVPDNVTTMAGVFVGPPGTPVEGQNAGWIAVCHHGPISDGERLVKPIKDLGPVADFIGPTNYGAMQTLFDAGAAAGGRNYWRSNFIRELSDDVLETVLAHADDLPKPGTMVLLEHLGGAVGRVGETETAFANRGADFNVSVLGSWADASLDSTNIDWVKSFGDELRAFATGGAYVNYMAGDASQQHVQAAYEANFERLVDIKRKYDPTNFFSGNQNIAP